MNIIPLVAGLLSDVIPGLVHRAEKLFGPGDGAKKHDWVSGCAKTLIEGLDKVLPSWAKPSEEFIQAMITAAIETALTALHI